jgi:hypothetical protein
MATKPVLEADTLPKVGVTVVSLIIVKPVSLTIFSESGRIPLSPSLCCQSSAVLTKLILSSVSCIVYSGTASGLFGLVVRVVGNTSLSPGGGLCTDLCAELRIVGVSIAVPGLGLHKPLCAELRVVGVSIAVPGVGPRKNLCAVLGIIGISNFASRVRVLSGFSIRYRIEGRGHRGGFVAVVCRREAASEEGKGECARENDVGRAAMGERQHSGLSVEVQVRWT